MSEPFLGEIRMTSFGFAARGWALCNGQILAINQNQALFSLLGTTYGGNGTTNFALPDLRGRVPFHLGGGHALGERAGEQSHTLTTTELPAHTHLATASVNAASAASPLGAYWATTSAGVYGTTAQVALGSSSIVAAGGGAAHENMSPYLTISFMIALQGIFPSRN